MCAWKNSILDHYRTKNCSGQNLDQEPRGCLIWQEFLQVDKSETKLMRYMHVPPRRRFSSWPCLQIREVTCRSSSHLTTYPLVHFILNLSIQLIPGSLQAHLLAQSVSLHDQSHTEAAKNSNVVTIYTFLNH